MKRIIKYIPIALLILQCGLIFFFSAQSKESSTKVSNEVVGVVMEATPVSAENLNKKQFEAVEIAVRKSAHFIMFFVLGIYALLSSETTKLKHKIVAALMFCLAYAASDEIHQLFNAGRSCEIRDILIDFCGSTLGIFIALFIKKKIKKRGVV